MFMLLIFGFDYVMNMRKCRCGCVCFKSEPHCVILEMVLNAAISGHDTNSKGIHWPINTLLWCLVRTSRQRL